MDQVGPTIGAQVWSEQNKGTPQEKSDLLFGKVTDSVLKFGLVRMAGHVPGTIFFEGAIFDHKMALNFANLPPEK